MMKMEDKWMVNIMKYDGDEVDQNEPGMEDNEQHQQNRPKYNSA